MPRDFESGQEHGSGLSQTAYVPPPSAALEARILNSTIPESGMSCDDFEQYLTDYLDGFLPASLFHRWERHAALCAECTELPGQVVRTIGACYTYKGDELPLPVGLNERILEATLGTAITKEVKAPLAARLAPYVFLDPIVSPQFATVATMLLVAVFVLTTQLLLMPDQRSAMQRGFAGQGLQTVT